MADAQTLKQLVLGRKDVQDMSDTEHDLPPDLMTINMGPSHPAMHGTVRIVLTVDGEKVVKSDVQPGYLHRCFEKESEHATYTQVFPYTDRLNYVSPMINNCGWAMVAEKLMGLTGHIPKRAEYIRVIVSEMSRLTDHLTCGTQFFTLRRRTRSKFQIDKLDAVVGAGSLFKPSRAKRLIATQVDDGLDAVASRPTDVVRGGLRRPPNIAGDFVAIAEDRPRNPVVNQQHLDIAQRWSREGLQPRRRTVDSAMQKRTAFAPQPALCFFENACHSGV